MLNRAAMKAAAGPFCSCKWIPSICAAQLTASNSGRGPEFANLTQGVYGPWDLQKIHNADGRTGAKLRTLSCSCDSCGDDKFGTVVDRFGNL